MVLTCINICIFAFALIGLIYSLIIIFSTLDDIIICHNQKKARKANIKRIHMYCDGNRHHVPWKCEEQAITMVMSGYPIDKVYRYLHNNTITLDELYKRMEDRKKKNEK